MNVTIARPREGLISSFTAMRDAFVAAGEASWTGIEAVAHADVPAYLKLLEGWREGVRLPAFWEPGPADRFWIVLGDDVVGEIDLRHRVNDALRNIGGHIGYHVHPAYRNLGIATEALRLALDTFREYGHSEALLTCSDDNAASVRVIEKCGGRRIADAIGNGPKRRRYSIDLT